MTARLSFLAIAAFWVTMNVLLWHREFGSHDDESPVPAELVWRTILKCPDASSLNVYQNGRRTGYCEFSTAVGQEMANLDADKPPPEGLVAHAGYQIRLAGNVALGDFTNRLKFDGRVQYSSTRRWRELNLKISSRMAVVEIHSLATNQTVQVKITSDGVTWNRELPFADLQNPDKLLPTFIGHSTDALLGAVELPAFPAGADTMEWDANRTRIKIGTETMPIYRLQASALGHTITVEVSTLGEILSIEVPGGVDARIDELGPP
jgi:hypothetical protein